MRERIVPSSEPSELSMAHAQPLTEKMRRTNLRRTGGALSSSLPSAPFPQHSPFR